MRTRTRQKDVNTYWRSEGFVCCREWITDFFADNSVIANGVSWEVIYRDLSSGSPSPHPPYQTTLPPCSHDHSSKLMIFVIKLVHWCMKMLPNTAAWICWGLEKPWDQNINQNCSCIVKKSLLLFTRSFGDPLWETDRLFCSISARLLDNLWELS